MSLADLSRVTKVNKTTPGLLRLLLHMAKQKDGSILIGDKEHYWVRRDDLEAVLDMLDEAHFYADSLLAAIGPENIS
jgi:uncharacterized protein (UPF0216 family)